MLKRNAPLNGRVSSVLASWFKDGNAVLFDIETTGLSFRRTQLYLIGTIAEENGIWILRQWFLDDPKEEKELLVSFSSYLRSFYRNPDNPPVLIHYNGDTFDVPYIRNKCSVYSLPDPFDGMISLDIYRKLRPFRKLFGLEKMRQKDLERCLAIGRQDEMDGGELVSVYQTFIHRRDGESLRLLLLHNHDDVIGMAELLSALAVPELFNSPKVQDDGPDVTDRSVTFTIQTRHQLPEVFLQKILPLNVLMSRPGPAGKRREELPSPEPVRLTLRQKGNDLRRLQLSVPLYRGTLLHFFPDYRNYWYFPAQDGVIHKDLAIYASAEHREKARPENCYQRVTDRVFCPQPEEIYTPSCRRSYRAFPSWFIITDDVFRDKNKCGDYIRSLMKMFTV